MFSQKEILSIYSFQMKIIVPILGFFIALQQANINLLLTLAQQMFATSLPFFGLSCYYLLVMSYFLFPKIRASVTKISFLWAQLCGILDFVGNVLMIVSLRYTNIASLTLFLCLTGPLSMIFAMFILKHRFTLYQIAANIFTVICGVIYAYLDSQSENGKNPILGDLLIVIGVTIYSLGSVLNEKFSVGFSPFQYQAQVSVSPLVLSLILFFIFEFSSMMNINVYGLLCLLGYSVCVLTFYPLYFLMLTHADAVLFNVAVMGANFFTFIYAVFIFKNSFVWYVFLPVIGLLIGVGLYVAATIIQERKVLRNQKMPTDEFDNSEALGLLQNQSTTSEIIQPLDD